MTIHRAAGWSRAARKEIGLHLDSSELGKITKNSVYLALGKMEGDLEEGRGAHPCLNRFLRAPAWGDGAAVHGRRGGAARGRGRRKDGKQREGNERGC
jgi:hypothetical protein